MSNHVAIWLDHKEARIVHFHQDRIDESIIEAKHPLHHKHPKSAGGDREHPDDDKRFFGEVARSLEGIEDLLLVGPSTAKLEFLRYLETHDPTLRKKVVGLETVDHPTQGQLVAHAKEYFQQLDRTRRAVT